MLAAGPSFISASIMKEGKQLHHRQQESAASTTTQLKEAKEAQPEHDSGFDARHPLYVGTWKRTVPDVDWTIAQDDLDEPHVKRRQAILARHPHITKLYGHEPLTKWVTLAAVVAQVALAFFFGATSSPGHSLHWTWTVATAYVVGGSITQLYGVIIHEATHGLCFATSPLANRLLGLFANVGIVFPIFASFRRYHLDHHAFQGVFGKDPDLPLSWEYKFVRGNPFAKLLFLFFYPMMYVVRGAALQKTPSAWELINWAFTITTDLIIYKTCGAWGLFYLFLSLWFGYGIHPAAAHFIQEHFTFSDGQETYSYYGALNYFFLNIGYHNEHHDFTKVPWSNLPKVKAIASEFYDTLSSHSSWLAVHYNFVFDSSIGPISRVGRDYEDHKKGRKMIYEKKKLQSGDAKARQEVEENVVIQNVASIFCDEGVEKNE